MYEKYAKLRDAKGVNDFTVAKAVGFSPVVLSDWKHGKSKPKVDKIMKLAKYFDVPLEELLDE